MSDFHYSANPSLVGALQGDYQPEPTSLADCGLVPEAAWQDPERLSPVFWSRVIQPEDTDCWEWIGCKMPNGYGQMSVTSRHLYAHRVSYELHVGLIPEGLQIDHLCRNRGCVNPAHLEAVTPAENTRRGNSPSAQAHRAGVCPRGHSYAEEASRRRDGTVAYCRACRREKRATQRLAAQGGVEQPSPRERAYELARTHLAQKSPDAVGAARGVAHTEGTSA